MTLTVERSLVLSEGAMVSYHLAGRGELRRLLLRPCRWLVLGIVICGVVRFALYDEMTDYSRACVGSGYTYSIDYACVSQAEAGFRRGQAGLMVTMLVGGLALAGFLLSYQLVRQERTRYQRSLRNLPLIERGSFSRDLRAEVGALATKMGITRAIEFRLAPGLHAMPSVTEDERAAILVVPQGFKALILSDRQAAIAILAHELGHVRERDAWLFPAQILFARLSMLVLIPLIMATLFVPAAVGSPVVFNGPIWATTFWSLLKVRRNVYEARLASERRADIYACVHADPAALARVFEAYVSRRAGTTRHHPHPDDRAAAARQVASKLATPLPPPITPEQHAALSARKRPPGRFRTGWRPGQ